MAKLSFRRNADTQDLVTGPRPAANTNDDLFTLDLSGFQEGYGFSTSITADATGGYRGEFYLDSGARYAFTSIERFNITGTDYADTIITGNGADVIKAGGGNDIVQAGAGRDTLDGGAGIDGFNKTFTGGVGVSVNLTAGTITASQGTVKNFEYFYNVVGTTGADTFISSQFRGNDNVNGGEGNDRAEFRIGDDDFTGGGGTDTLKADHSWWTGSEGIQTSLSVDSGGGYRGYYYVNGGQRVDFTTTEAFEVLGTKNDDRIDAGNGNDILSGNGGNDDIRSGSGNDTLDGGDGLDGLGRDLTNLGVAISINLQTSTVTAAYGTIAGFEYFSAITGSAQADTFVTTAVQANDLINGGSGADTATFYEGYDTFNGSLGADRLIVDYSAQNTDKGIEMSFNADADGGWRGYYYVDGNTRTDFTSVESFAITGTAFDDRITTGNNDDTVSAGAGNDVVTSGLGNDTLVGGLGIDGLGRDFTAVSTAVSINLRTDAITAAYGTIAAFEYFSGVTGGAGNDSFVTTAVQADDYVTGGGGDDTATFYEGYDRYTAGSNNVDRLVIDYSAQNTNKGIESSLNVDTNGGWYGNFYVDGNTRVDYSSVETFQITGTAYDDSIYTGDGNDTVAGGAGFDYIRTGGGVDTLDGGTGIDGVARNMTGASYNIVVNLAAGTATAAIGTIKNFEYFGAGGTGFAFTTGDGNDQLVSTTLQLTDYVDTGTGNDTFTSYNGYDRYTAGVGTDRLVIDWSGVDNLAGISSVQQGADTTGGYQGYYYVNNVQRVDFSSVEAFTVTGTKYADVLAGKEFNDVLSGGAGDDRIYAGSGDDVVDGGAGIDGLQKDMTGIGVKVTVDVDAGTLSLPGSSFTGIEYLLDLRGGEKDDKITTGHGLYNDVVWGNAGNDTASFFGGSDTFNAGSGTRDVLVIDYSAVDTDAAVSSSVNVDNDNGGFRGYFSAGGVAEVSFTGTEVFNVTGTRNNDTLNGGDGADTLDGSDGRDTLNGGGGLDKLFGGDAADTLNGGDGNDQLTGGAGGDTMTGGAGADKFLFGPGDINGANGSFAYLDRITDFEAGVDEINLSRIDADTGAAGNQAFTFVTGAFTAAGQVHLVNVAGVTYLQGNFNADLTADFSIRVEGTAPLATDLVL